MKLLVVLLALAAGLWLWRSARQSPTVGPKHPGKPARKGPQVIVACSLCQVHVPQGDALTGRNGQYCCAAHRLQAEP